MDALPPSHRMDPLPPPPNTDPGPPPALRRKGGNPCAVGKGSERLPPCGRPRRYPRRRGSRAEGGPVAGTSWGRGAEGGGAAPPPGRNRLRERTNRSADGGCSHCLPRAFLGPRAVARALARTWPRRNLPGTRWGLAAPPPTMAHPPPLGHNLGGKRGERRGTATGRGAPPPGRPHRREPRRHVLLMGKTARRVCSPCVDSSD